jgi:hypothetical protein
MMTTRAASRSNRPRLVTVWPVGMVLLPLLMLGLAAPCPAAPPTGIVDAAYAQALFTADLFLWAWQTCDADLGLQLISRELLARLQQPGSQAFQMYMEGLSNPHHVAFEITGGRMLGPDRAAFSVTLFDLYNGEPQGNRYDSTMELALDPNAPAMPDSLLRRLRPEAASHFRITEDVRWKVDVLPEAN